MRIVYIVILQHSAIDMISACPVVVGSIFHIIVNNIIMCLLMSFLCFPMLDSNILLIFFAQNHTVNVTERPIPAAKTSED